ELDNALESVLKSLSLREEVDIKVDTAFTHQLVGTVYTAKGELDQALEHFKESETIGEEYNHVFLSALSSYSIGGNYLSKGELDQALTYYQKTLAIKETLPFGLTQNTLNNLGIIFINKGELDQGLEYYKRSLAINEASGNQRSIAINLGNIGEAYIAKDDLKSAAECFNRALDIYRNLNNDWGVAEVLYNLVQYFVDDLSSDTTSSYLDEFKEINTRRKDVPIISQKFRLTKAIVLKSSERLTDKMTALSIFQEIADEEVVWYELTVAAMLNLGKLLILELKTTGNEKVLTDVKKIADQLQDIAEKQNSYWLLVETYLLQSKLALMELNVEQALQLLNQTEQLANEKKLSQLIKTISIERDLLTTQLTKWEEIIDKKPSVSERIQLTQLNTLLERMLHREQYHNEKEIMKYAEEARQLVEAWEK
ncbi:MAG: tetratricopeptide repeat protein, partial [Candidatus Heimdallarchaeota archaeon]